MPHARLDPLDLFDTAALLSDEERLIRQSIARFVDERALPLMRSAFEQHRFPLELVPQMASLGLFGPGLAPVPYGLIAQELEAETRVAQLLFVRRSLACTDRTSARRTEAALAALDGPRRAIAASGHRSARRLGPRTAHPALRAARTGAVGRRCGHERQPSRCRPVWRRPRGNRGPV